MSVEPAPISARHTPSSFSSARSVLSAAISARQAHRFGGTAQTYEGIARGGHIRDKSKIVTIIVSHVQYETPGRHYAICHTPVNRKAHLSNLLLTMAHKMGVRTERFADSNGTVSEVES